MTSLRILFSLLASILTLTGCVPGVYGSTRPVVKIGLAAPFEGLGRPIGYEALQGVKLALAQRNAEGGVAGSMIELVALDDSNQPDRARLQAREFAADPAVLGVIAGWKDEVSGAALPVYREEGLGVVVPWSTSPGLADASAGLLLLAADSELIAQRLTQRITEGGYRRVAVVGEDSAVVPYLDLLGERGRRVPLPEAPGGEVLREWTARLILARPPPPDALVIAADGADAGAVVEALREMSWRGSVFGNADVASAQLVDVAGTAADGTLLASPAPTGDDLAGLVGGQADELGPRAIMAYDATNVLLGALEAAIEREGKPTRQGVIAALRAVRVRGLTGDIEFDVQGRRREAPVWLYRIEGGQWSNLTPIRNPASCGAWQCSPPGPAKSGTSTASCRRS
jgi:branched-chain amino acid transport system substrate-binding protein